MCCFAGPVTSVKNTRIFARLSGQGTQFIAYQMSYRSDKPNAMILPLPAQLPAAEKSIRFIDLSGYDRFFSDMKRGFPNLKPPPSAGRILNRASPDSKAIEVHKVGNFVASFVPSMDDFERLDPRFAIPKSTWGKIPAYADYSFAVFQLNDLAGEPHPMAFEFATRIPDKIFFPTVHIHDGEVHSSEQFHHDLYLQHPAYDQAAGSRYTQKPDIATKLVRSKSVASEFLDVEKSQGLVSAELLVHRQGMHGDYPNRDILLSTSGLADATSLNFLSPRIIAPLAAVIPLGWIIYRRNQLSKQQP